MTISSLRLVPAQTPDTRAVHALVGTLPVRTFHPEGFFGTVQIDGQSTRVAALATAEGKLLMLSLVGYDTTVSAALAQLWQGKSVFFTPKTGVPWAGPQMLARRPSSYKQFSAKLAGTSEVHVIALSLDAHIGEGLLTPPVMQRPAEEKPNEQAKVPTALLFPNGGPRFLLGNWDEEEPHQRAFLANLYVMRVILLHQRDQAHPERLDQWARELWNRGLVRRLVVPVETLGIKAWAIVGTTPQWNHLIGQGVREGWLPWRAEERFPMPRLADAA